MILRLTCIISLLLSAQVWASGDWHERKAEGWAWHEEITVSEDEQQEVAQESGVSQTSYSEKLEKIQQDLKELKARAILEPTQENVLAYQFAQAWIMNQTEKFTESWKRNLVETAELDPTIAQPANHYGSKIYKQAEQKRRHDLIQSVVKERGLLFFFKGGELDSQAFARVVRTFSLRYGVQVLGISVDGEGVAEFPESKPDNGITRTLRVEHYPALFLVDPKSEAAKPISYGMRTVDQIEQNLLNLISMEVTDAE